MPQYTQCDEGIELNGVAIQQEMGYNDNMMHLLLRRSYKYVATTLK